MQKAKETQANVETANNEIKKPTIKLDYKENVLATNQRYKKAIHGSLGGVRTLILAMNEAEKIEVGLNPIFEKVLNDSKGKTAENKAIYEFLKANVRTSKSGNYGIFFTLQSLNGIFKDKDLFTELLDCYSANNDKVLESFTSLTVETVANAK